MRARLILEGLLEAGHPLVAEVVSVETEAGEMLDVAGFAVPSGHVARNTLEREPEGRPLFVYTREP